MNNTNAVNNGGNSKVEAGLWVDHREALIVVLSKSGTETKHIQSDAQKQLRRTGDPSIGRFEYQEVPADDSRQRAYSGYLARYYDEIVEYLRHAGAILIFGPGEAKVELKKRFEKECPGAHIVTMETTDKMTEGQIVAHVRHHFELDVAKQGT
jgi:stalled ribosome rescue protein Dom34